MANTENSSAEQIRALQKSIWENIVRFSQAVQAGRNEQGFGLLKSILQNINDYYLGFGGSQLDISPLAERQATVFCSALTSMFCSPNFAINDTQLFTLAPFKGRIAECFEISGYRGTEHLPDLIGKRTKSGGVSLSSQAMAKFYLLLSINALTPRRTEVLLQLPVDLAWILCLGYLSEKLIWSENGQKARAEILRATDRFSGVSPLPQNIYNLGQAYMACSYDESPGKHEIKRVMNSAIRRWLGSLGVEDIKKGGPRKEFKDRPRILIILEDYNSKHAMHRCYGPYISSLRRKFELVVMTRDGNLDKELNSMFDVIDTTRFKTENPKVFIDKARSYRPDIVYYPSVGMRMIGIICSNVRLAPIQIFSNGHPATTHSHAMDYSLVPEKCSSASDLYSEKLVAIKDQPVFVMRDDAETIEPAISEKPDTVRIAVAAYTRKISPGFLQVCREIQKMASKEGRQTEFCFFPNSKGSTYQAFRRRVTNIIKSSVFPSTNYNNYIRALSACDIFLSTFPFGGTNSLVDASLQGLPIVNLVGPEVHEKVDSVLLESIEQPDWLTANSVPDYVDAALRLILSDEERVEISNRILASDPASKFFVEKDSEVSYFCDTFALLYEKHEKAINTSGTLTLDNMGSL